MEASQTETTRLPIIGGDLSGNGWKIWFIGN